MTLQQQPRATGVLQGRDALQEGELVETLLLPVAGLYHTLLVGLLHPVSGSLTSV